MSRLICSRKSVIFFLPFGNGGNRAPLDWKKQSKAKNWELSLQNRQHLIKATIVIIFFYISIMLIIKLAAATFFRDSEL